MTNIIRLARQMAKPELIGHLESEHSQAVTKRIEPHRWTKDALADMHRIIHLGLGAGAEHDHRSPPWLQED